MHKRACKWGFIEANTHIPHYIFIKGIRVDNQCTTVPFPYIHNTEPLQSGNSITAEYIQYHCKAHTVSLQSAYSITAKRIQYYCKAYTVSLQSTYSIAAEHIQYHCKAYTAVMQAICSSYAKHIQQHCNTNATPHYFSFANIVF